MEYKKILVPMDFSDCAKNAFNMALEIADRTGASIDLVCVTHLPHLHAEMVGAAAVVQPLLNDYHQLIDEQFEELKQQTDLKNTQVEMSKYNAPLHDAIYSCALQNRSDLIVTGTKSQHDWLVNVLGSNSTDMIDRSKAPVIVVPENSKIKAFRRIGVAIDYSDFGDPELLDPLRTFALLYESSLCFLNVTTKHHKLFVYDDIKVSISDYFKELKQSYHTYTDSRPLNEILLEAIKDLDLDMLFMLPKNHSVVQRLLKTSNTKSMALHIDKPLMTIHEKTLKS
ncbi:MAG: universal stress protein [Reichenbachiella sp.]|uniref:universal stress protein n=1 Tax=Reichenbachiella sp. TaxID=2184521 RepID=UPI003264FEE1